MSVLTTEQYAIDYKLGQPAQMRCMLDGLSIRL